jgi:hypothetical protein
VENKPRLEGMSRRDRVIYLLAGLALICLYPGLQWIRFWPQSEARMAAFGEMETDAKDIFRLSKRPLRCDESFERQDWSWKRPGPTISRKEIQHYGIYTRTYVWAGLSDEGQEDGVWTWDIRLTSGIRELTKVVDQLRDHQQHWRPVRPWCTVERAGGVKAAEMEARRQLDEYVGTLRRYWKTMQLHAAEHERVRPWITAIALAALALEIAGAVCLLVIVRRTWLRWRASKSPPPPGDGTGS